MPFIGLQIRPGENRHHVLRDFMVAAKELGSTFKILKLLGPLDLGRTQFLRFETDCGRNYAQAAAKKLGRGHIIERDGVYTATYPGWSGPVSSVGMHLSGHPNYRKTYRGPGKKFWERQFDA